jgi:hypothetical protein
VPIAAQPSNDRAPESHTDHSGTDRGTVVSRAQIEHQSRAVKPKKIRTPTSQPKEDSLPPPPAATKKHKLTEKHKSGEKKRKKQSGKKGGDEFSSLFGSL